MTVSFIFIFQFLSGEIVTTSAVHYEWLPKNPCIESHENWSGSCTTASVPLKTKHCRANKPYHSTSHIIEVLHIKELLIESRNKKNLNSDSPYACKFRLVL